mmetsp:Transcript_11351/g.31975  ORF Transcript_11351/g.31975 Transcript_11351/m.31975 type:complete len:253 (+) Transcript_11351:1074-1832(+)
MKSSTKATLSSASIWNVTCVDPPPISMTPTDSICTPSECSPNVPLRKFAATHARPPSSLPWMMSAHSGLNLYADAPKVSRMRSITASACAADTARKPAVAFSNTGVDGRFASATKRFANLSNSMMFCSAPSKSPFSAKAESPGVTFFVCLLRTLISTFGTCSSPELEEAIKLKTWIRVPLLPASNTKTWWRLSEPRNPFSASTFTSCAQRAHQLHHASLLRTPASTLHIGRPSARDGAEGSLLGCAGGKINS